jgi:TolA-binding protein
VSTDKEGIKSVNYSKLSALLIEAVKEQKGLIDQQQDEIASLQNELAELKELKAQVNQLTQLVMKQNEPANTTEVGEE